MNDHNLFEESYKNLFGEFPKCVFFDDGCYKLIRAAEGNDIFNSTKIMINASWIMWCSSANIDGYKLVPVEPTYKQLDAIKNSCVSVQKACLSDLEAYGIYKDVIGVLDER